MSHFLKKRLSVNVRWQKDCACIVNLVVARELSLYFAPIRSSIVEFAVHILGRHYPALLFRPIEGGLLPHRRTLGIRGVVSDVVCPTTTGTPGLMIPGFLRGYFFESVP